MVRCILLVCDVDADPRIKLYLNIDLLVLWITSPIQITQSMKTNSASTYVVK